MLYICTFSKRPYVERTVCPTYICIHRHVYIYIYLCLYALSQTNEGDCKAPGTNLVSWRHHSTKSMDHTETDRVQKAIFKIIYWYFVLTILRLIFFGKYNIPKFLSNSAKKGHGIFRTLKISRWWAVLFQCYECWYGTQNFILWLYAGVPRPPPSLPPSPSPRPYPAATPGL